MVFQRATPRHPDFFARWVSTGGQWELGMTQMLFGVRIRFGRVDSMCLELDYCAGADIEFQVELLKTVMTILIPVNEDVSNPELRDLFPTYEVKPINQDPTCWIRLQELAAKVLSCNQETG
jgi:hypothetical protein